jgi:hypothetical protein
MFGVIEQSIITVVAAADAGTLVALAPKMVQGSLLWDAAAVAGSCLLFTLQAAWRSRLVYVTTMWCCLCDDVSHNALLQLLPLQGSAAASSASCLKHG